MKNRHLLSGLIFSCAALAVLPSSASADFQGPVSIRGTETMSVDKILGLKMDRKNVCVSGQITSQLASGDDTYMFTDMTGEMVVEIDYDVFRGHTVTPESKVRLCGEVDVKYLKPNKFEAETLEVLP